MLSLMLVGGMAISMLGACSKPEADKGEKASKVQSSASSGKASVASNTVPDGKPSTWIADRTINIQAYVDDIGYSLPKDFNNTPVMQEITKRNKVKCTIYSG